MRIGILGSEGSWYVEQLCRKAEQLRHTPVPLIFSTLRGDVRGRGCRLMLGETDVAGLDAVIVRTMPPGSLEQVVTRMDFLAAAAESGVTIVNPPKAIECAVDKYLTTYRLSRHGIPVPETIVCETADAAMEAFENLGGDIVVKPIFGAEGRGILRVSHPEMAVRTFRTLERLNAVLYLQKFIQTPDGDVRILLLDGKLVAAMRRFPAPGDFRANVAQHGRAEPWSPTDQELALALQSADITGCVFAGIDLMYNEDGHPLVLEVNAVPGWKALQKTCSIDVPDRLIRWLDK
ncbi:MAG: RimK family alpha-L-glutamate ligase [Planctomycetaceae bacterium]|nr:RimK family alpha-L-glutamate ligase [Planctomycetaceae bacterium]